MSWVHRNDLAQSKSGRVVRVPLYLDRTRRQLLFTVELACDASTDLQQAAQRGIALVASSLL